VQPSALKTVTEATECNVALQVLLLILQSQRNHLILLHKFRCFLMEREGMTAKTKGCRRYRVQSWQGVVSVRVKGTEAA
jgi:hypothetical protein